MQRIHSDDSAIESQPQPPVDNAHIAPGCEQFSEATIAANARPVPTIDHDARMCFSGALLHLKGGACIARAGWNGRGMFVYMVPANSYPAQTGAAKAHFGDGALVPYRAYLALVGVDGAVSTWAPSVGDTLAEDWLVVNVAPL